ncbi:MAG: PAS domain S-box protein [Candidatus Aminicenantes bacterium]|nr:PAS domain S-box protein [Candidatus Aminicenantes bacterium]
MRGVGLFLNNGDMPPSAEKKSIFSSLKSFLKSRRKSRPKPENGKGDGPARRFFKLAPNSKSITVIFRWLVILVLTCFVVFSPEKYTPQRFLLILGLIAAYFLSNLFLSFMSERAFQKARVGRFLFFVDILLIAVVMYFIRGFETDLYLVFFLIIFVAAMQHGGLRRSWVTGLVTAVLYLSLYLRNNTLESLLDSYVLLRVPFFFLVAVFSSFYIDQLGREVVRRKQAEAKSEQVLEQFKTLVNTIPDIIFELDETGNFTFISDAVRGAGYSPEELLGKHFSAIVHPEELNHVSRNVMLGVLQGKTVGELDAPKLFDERRTAGRMTRNLVIKMLLGPAAVGTEPYIYVEMHSSGKWGFDAATGKKSLQGSFGIIRDMKVPELRHRADKKNGNSAPVNRR